MNRYAHIDAMRAFAVLLVVFSHAGLSFVPGGSGVTIFFVISGFIITFLLLREREQTGGFDVNGFYMRRLIKIFPPMLLALIIPTLIYMSLGGKIDIIDFLGQIFFFFNWRYLDSQVTVLPGSVVTWSLSIEEQFYLVFALIWLFAVKSKHYKKIVAGIASTAIVYSICSRIYLSLHHATGDRIYFGTGTRVEAIALGTLVALWFFTYRNTPAVQGRPVVGTRFRNTRRIRDGRTVPLMGRNTIVILAVLLYLVSLLIRDEFFRQTIRYTIQAIAAAMMILWGQVAIREKLGDQLMHILRWKGLQLLGLASYSIYISHDVLYHFLEPHLGMLPRPVLVLTLVASGLTLGILMYRCIEVPALRYKDRHFASVHAKARQQSS
ncbi:acyltransferase family protein [Rothia sp. P7181]|uniref:acyltransferase family protein n=1 Tax=unclassified Rothia (in: high G+C Gram-positive bacteria) TaxID=2689056 RepID=UPI003AC57006